MLIRPARPEDAGAVAEVHTRSWQATYEHLLGAERLATIDVGRRRALAKQAIGSGGEDELLGVAVAEVRYRLSAT
jgi:hypothetical protein